MSNVAQLTYKLNPFSEPFSVPPELLKRKQWIGWLAVWTRRDKKTGKVVHLDKPRKIPINIKTGQSDGYDTPEGHVTYDEALAAVGRLGLSGVGFMLMPGCGLVGGDMDKCRDPVTGVIDAWVQAIIDLHETYFEVSPSGAGVRFWALIGDLPVTLKKDNAGVELYSQGRYLTFTGEHIKGTPWEVHRAEGAIKALWDRAAQFGPSKAAAGPSAGGPVGTGLTFEEIASRKAYRESPMGRINQAALAHIPDWAPELFPQGEAQATGAWRVKAADLDRPFEEDISIHPDGIWDFALRESKTAIDIVMDWSDPQLGAEEAAEWLGVRVGVPFDAASTGSSGASIETPDPGPLVALPYVSGRVLPAREWLVAGWVPMNKVTLLQGDGGDGKTLLTHQLQASAATSLPWIGLQIEPVVSCGFYTEDDAYDVDERQAAIDLAYGVECCTAGLGLHRFPRADEDNELVVFDKARRPVLTKFYDRMVEAVLDLRGRLLALDVAVDLFGGNEIVRPEVRALFRPLGRLARQMPGGGAVVMSTHVSQSGIRTDGGHSGSTDWSNASRSRLYLNRPRDDRGNLLDPDTRTLTRKKANYAALGDKVDLRWERGVLVPLGGQSAAAGAFRRSALDVFMDILDAVTREKQDVSHKFRAGNYAPTVFARRSHMERSGYGRGDFERALQEAFKARRVVIVGYGRPSKGLEKLAKNVL